MKYMVKMVLIGLATFIVLPLIVVSAVLATPTELAAFDASPMGTTVTSGLIDYANGNSVRIRDKGTAILVSNGDESASATIHMQWTPVVQSKLRFPSIDTTLAPGETTIFGSFPKEMYSDGWVNLTYTSTTSTVQVGVIVTHIPQ